MIKLLLSLIITFALAFLVYILFKLQQEKYNLELSERDKAINDVINKIKEKNLKIRELQNELKRRNNK